jgi:zinc/manganese transport system substrate-binding protein
VLLVASGTLLALHYLSPSSVPSNSSGGIRVVAAENFWGSLISQMGGDRVTVLSIVSDPNADPHDYESNATDAAAVAQAKLVIENGAGYDDWCQRLVLAGGSTTQIVLNVANLLGFPAGSNPHFWYGRAYVNTTVAAMYSDLVTIDPQNTSYFQQQYATLNASLAPVWAQEYAIQHQFAGTQVASTETIFADMANSTGLNLVSPWAFMQAVAEGTDPPASSVTTFENQLSSGNVSVLVYNLQTVTPLTDQMKAIAVQHNVSIVGVTETLQPPGVTFETWMEAELVSLQSALYQKAAGH